MSSKKSSPDNPKLSGAGVPHDSLINKRFTVSQQLTNLGSKSDAPKTDDAKSKNVISTESLDQHTHDTTSENEVVED